jgi:hypothetical protein
VIVVADRLPVTASPGEVLLIDVHVVSDLRVPVPGLRCTAAATWEGGGRTWRFEGDIDADAVVRVGTLALEVPDVDGRLELRLEVTGDGLPSTVIDTDATTVARGM